MPNFIIEFLNAVMFGIGVSVGVFVAGLVLLIAADVYFRRKQ